ncbi:MAG TPA: PilZ domain-containing protein [Candidatus Acidoferrum sp.]|nr:PilZ domain-containing protein [Candidatus Acidoferrum sp.]
MNDSDSKTVESPVAEIPVSELRRARRAKISRQVRVRPSEPRDDHFEDLPVSANASKHGIYFVSRRSSYYKGMRIFVTFPFTSAHDPMNCEYLAEVVRVEDLPKNRFGVAVDLKMTLNMNLATKPGPRV